MYRLPLPRLAWLKRRGHLEQREPCSTSLPQAKQDRLGTGRPLASSPLERGRGLGIELVETGLAAAFRAVSAELAPAAEEVGASLECPVGKDAAAEIAQKRRQYCQVLALDRLGRGEVLAQVEQAHLQHGLTEALARWQGVDLQHHRADAADLAAVEFWQT